MFPQESPGMRYHMTFYLIYKYDFARREVITDSVTREVNNLYLQSTYTIVLLGLRHNVLQSMFLMLIKHLFASNCTATG